MNGLMQVGTQVKVKVSGSGYAVGAVTYSRVWVRRKTERELLGGIQRGVVGPTPTLVYICHTMTMWRHQSTRSTNLLMMGCTFTGK